MSIQKYVQSGLICLVSLLILSDRRCCGDDKGNKASFIIDDGKAKGDGTITAVIKITDGGGQNQTISVPVKVKSGDDRTTTRDAIASALSQNNIYTQNFKPPENDKTTGYYYTTLTANTGVKVITAYIENPDQIAVQSYSGGTKLALNTTGFFQIFASAPTASSDDLFGIRLLNANADMTTFTDVNLTSFSLSSYAGLTPLQIETQLASLINADPLFHASLVGGEVQITGAFNPEFGVDMFTSDTTTHLGGRAGVMSVPEPAAFLLFGIGTLMLLCYAFVVLGTSCTSPNPSPPN
jgi:hypothetical protein